MYTMTFKVSAFPSSQNPQYTILPSLPPGNGPNGSETFTGNNTAYDYFSYAFVSNGAGIMYVTLYSPSAYWCFDTCEIMATPIGSN
jgi:hypothetical protein